MELRFCCDSFPRGARFVLPLEQIRALNLMRSRNYAFIGIVVTLVSSGVSLHAQLDCSDPVQASTAGCTIRPTAATPTETPSVYVDSAGLLRRSASPAPATVPMAVPDGLTAMQLIARESLGETLPVYGRDLFLRVPSTFAPGDQAQVTGDYLLGPGDEVILRTWGAETHNQQLTVDRAGNIFIPQFGSVHVAGLRFAELQPFLERSLRTSFRNFSLSVDLGHLRTIPVLVVGEAARPGSYTVSALSTMVDAVLASGGPGTHGSMRAIELRREGKTISTFDFYDLLQRGDRTKDVRLLPGDILVIPVVGPQVAIAGGVERAAIYEVRPGETLTQAIQIAGGLSASSDPSAPVSLERVVAGKGRVTMEIALQQASEPLHNGDVIRAGVMPHRYQQTVTLRGNLASPGRFGWKPGMRLSDILPEKSALLTADYWEHRNGLGVPTLSFSPEPASRTVEVGRRQASASVSTPTTPGPIGDATLPTNDASRRVTVSIAAPEINWRYAVIERTDAVTLHSELLPFDLGGVVDHTDPAQDLPLLPGDVVTIFSQNDVVASREQSTRYIRLEGEFQRSGIYSVRPGETIADVIARAGGITGSAYLYGASFTRESVRAIQQQRLDEYVASASKDMDQAAAQEMLNSSTSTSAINRDAMLASQRSTVTWLHSLRATGRIVLGLAPAARNVDDLGHMELEDGDVLRVPATPLIVTVVGAVHGPSTFRLHPGWKLRDYQLAAGDLRRGADPKQAFLIRADGSVIGRASAKRTGGAAFESLEIYPGDTLVVPEKPLKLSGIRTVLDYSQLASQFALSAASLSVISTR